MALTRLAAFPTGTILTSSQLTTEFDNIYNNALTLISPLTGNLNLNNTTLQNLALGSAAAPSLYFNANANTGLYSPAANQVGIAVAGVAAANFTAAAAGPHVIGSGTTNTRYALLHTGTITLSGATQEAGFAADQALTNASGVNLYGVYYTQTLTNVAGGTTTMAWLTINPGALTITAGSVTNAAGLYITGAPSGATNNYALWVGAGNTYLAGAVGVGTAPAGGSGVLTIAGNINANPGAAWNVGTSVAQDMLFQTNGVERARVTGAGTAGILLVGTTVTTSAGAGDLVIANAKNIRFVNAAGTDTFRAIFVGTSNQVNIGADTTDIQWGKALVALGAGAAATLGNIGGAGPATAGQNTWMRVLDTAGAAFWVPAWK